MLFFGFFNKNTSRPLPVSNSLLARRVIRDTCHVSLCCKIDITMRPYIVKAIHSATIMFKKIADGIVCIVFRFVYRNRALGDTGRKNKKLF